MWLPRIAASRSTWFFLLIGLCHACSSDRKERQAPGLVTRRVVLDGSVTYSFPEGTDQGLRDALIEECKRSVRENLVLIGEEQFTDTFDVEFVSTRREMQKYGGISASGLAYPERRVMFCILDKDFKRNTPIQHELMHMITMLKWGQPASTSTWMNEGLATWSAGTGDVCAGYSYERIYAFMLQNDKRVPLNDLAADFHGQPEMTAYTQSAFLAGELLAEQGPAKFIHLWQQGFAQFEAVYGIPYQRWQDALDERIRAKYPGPVSLDWEKLQQGC